MECSVWKTAMSRCGLTKFVALACQPIRIARCDPGTRGDCPNLDFAQIGTTYDDVGSLISTEPIFHRIDWVGNLGALC